MLALGLYAQQFDLSMQQVDYTVLYCSLDPLMLYICSHIIKSTVAYRIIRSSVVVVILNILKLFFPAMTDIVYLQQDAAEALAHLAAGLQEERDEYLNLHRPVSQSFGSVLGKDSPPPQLHRSWLHWPLEGTLGSLMACQQCGFQVMSALVFKVLLASSIVGQSLF